MVLRNCSVASLLIVSSLLFQLARGGSSGSVLFIDSQSRQYLRTPSTNDVDESQSMFLPEVGAAVSVLLGFAPPATISASGSSKLNEVLMPNPFDRPRAVFLLEVAGIGDTRHVGLTNIPLSTGFSSKIIPSSINANIQLPDEDDVSVVSLDDRPVDFTDNEIFDFASWLGGSYANDVSEPLSGHLTIPMANGASVNLHMSKKPDREFIASLLKLFRNAKTAMEMHEDLSQGVQKPAELLMGTLNGFKALQESDDSEGVVKQALELLFVTVSKVFDSMQAAYKGQIVGVVLLSGTPPSEPETMLNVMFTSRPSARWLVENNESTKSAIAEVILVRRTLAWLTGIILIIATLLGFYFLLNMPLTRDTLLYSNVKLD